MPRQYRSPQRCHPAADHLSQPVTAALPPGEEDLFWRAVEIATRFQPLNAEETQQLKTIASKLDPIFQA